MSRARDILSALADHCGEIGALVHELDTLLPRDEPAESVLVKNGDPFAQLLADAQPHSILRFTPDFVFDQPLKLTKPVTLQRDRISELPPQRIDPAILLPTFSGGVTITAPGVMLQGVSCVAPTKEATVLSDTGQQTWLDRVRVLGTTGGAHRGILAHGQGSRYTQCYVAGIYSGKDTQAICGYDGTKDLVVDDCFLEASGENVMFGGDDAASEDRIPQNIVITRCTLTKNLDWRALGPKIAKCKNLFELKNAKGVRFTDSDLTYSWAGGGQDGFAILVTVRNQEGTNPWATVEDVLIANNHVSHIGNGIQLLGTDDTVGKPSGPMVRVTIRDNVFEDISAEFGGAKKCVQLNRGSQHLSLSGNTFTVAGQAHSFLYFINQAFPHTNLRIEGNDAPEGNYGIFSDAGLPPGLPTLEAFAPGCIWNGNTLHKGTSGRKIVYPAGTTVV